MTLGIEQERRPNPNNVVSFVFQKQRTPHAVSQAFGIFFFLCPFVVFLFELVFTALTLLALSLVLRTERAGVCPGDTQRGDHHWNLGGHLVPATETPQPRFGHPLCV